MKKIIITSILSSLICVASFGQTLRRTILSHNGTLTQYDINHWTDAISDAVAGDTVYFTPGFFTGNATITKPITLIGSGEVPVVVGTDATSGDPITETYRTTIGGFIVDIDGEPTLSTCMFEGFHVNDNIHISKPIKGLKIKRCYIEDNFEAESTETTCTDLVLESCYFGNLYCGFLSNPNIYNCYFNQILTEGKIGLSFTNCTISYRIESTGCNYINCNVRYVDGDPNVFINCIYDTYMNDHAANGSDYINCYEVYSTYTNEWTAEYLENNNYLGNDGTIVGHLGGNAPYTLIPSQPYVSASTVAYDASNKKLNVNITVKKGK